METVKVKVEAKYVNHNVKSNKSIDAVFKMAYSELRQYIQSIQMLNENITVAAKVGSDKKPIKLGVFMLNNLNIDRDGEGKLKLNSMLDHVDANQINHIASRSDEPIILLLKADIDLEEEEDADDEDSEEDEE